MVFKCYICNCYDNTKSLFRIPNRNEKYSDRWRLWLKLIDEKEENMHRIRICADHFIKRKPAKKEDDLDVDWIPNRNLGRFSKNVKLIDYHLKKRTTGKHLHQQPTETNDDEAVNAAVVGETQMDTNEAVDHSSSDPVCAEFAQISNNNTFSNNGVLMPGKKRKIEIIRQQFFSPMEIQTELTARDIDLLFQYYQEALEERKELLLKISTLVIEYEFFKGSDNKTLFYTGLTTWKLLDRLFKLVEPFLPEHGNSKLSPFQMLVLTLMKMRLNLSFTDLGYRFQVDVATSSRYFHRCVCILYQLFKGSILVRWPDRKKLLNNTPSYFRSCFKEAVTVIIDCFEIFAETSSMLQASAQEWSQYKHHATLKFLIGISITGAIIFISRAFGGRASDKYITTKSNFLDNLQEGDFVLADKGFKIKDEVEEKNAALQIPCFVKNGEQLHPSDIEETRELANVRIHVERVIRQLRAKYTICSDTARISAISKQSDLFDGDLYDKIVFVSCCLVNMCPSVVTHDFEM